MKSNNLAEEEGQGEGDTGGNCNCVLGDGEWNSGQTFAGSGRCVSNNRRGAVGGTSQDTSVSEKGASGTVKNCLRNRMGDLECG